jgi:hypothetical protein
MEITFKIKDFPPDVASLICSFGYPEYKEHMKDISNHLIGLLEYNLYLLEEDYLKLCRMNYIQCMPDYLTYAIEDEVLEDLFKQCTKCCCCSKHCHNRPTNYYTDELSIGENFETSEQCHCKCRSLSRNIKRAQCLKLENYKKIKKCRRKTTFNIQFIPLSSRTLPRRALFHQVNPPIQP